MEFPLADLRGLAATLGDVLREPLSQGAQRGLSDGDLVASLRVVEDLGRWVDAARLSIAGEIGARAEPGAREVPLVTAYGCDNTAELVERAVGVSHATARARLRAARAITARTTLTGQDRPAPLDHARRELAAGRLSLDALTTIADALRPLQRRVGTDDLVAAETELVQAAVGVAGEPPCGIHELRIMAQTWALHLDPDGTLPDEDSERLRTFRLGRERNRLIPLHANVTPDVAAGLVRLFDAHLNPRVEDRGPRFFDAADGADAGDTGLPVDDESVRDPRTADQKRHDAFAAIIAMAAASPDSPRLGGAAPTLVVTVSADQLDRPDGVAFMDGPDGETAVSATFARHIGCHGTIHRVALGANGAITALTVADRVFTGTARPSAHATAAASSRDAGCARHGAKSITSSSTPAAGRPTSATESCSAGIITERSRPAGGRSACGTEPPRSDHPPGSTRADDGRRRTGCSTTSCDERDPRSRRRGETRRSAARRGAAARGCRACVRLPRHHRHRRRRPRSRRPTNRPTKTRTTPRPTGSRCRTRMPRR